MQLETAQFIDHISYLDNGLLDSPGLGSTYVVRGDEIAIVETGTSRCAPNILAGVRKLGIDPAVVRHIVLTHIHMDHAGGAGTLLSAMPDAQVYIHSRTAPFLVDPSKLLLSAERALGPLFPLHGTVDPLPADRIVPAENLRLDLGRGVVLHAIETSGHSPDHLSYYEENSRSLFTGDAIGISVPSMRYDGPVTPPPAVSLTDQQATFEKLAALDIETLLFSHYGPNRRPPRDVIAHLRERYDQLVDLVQPAWERGDVDHDAIVRTMLDNAPIDTQAEWAVAGWIEMSIRGLVVYYNRQAKQQAG